MKQFLQISRVYPMVIRRFQLLARCASFDVALIQARRASECTSLGFVMHLLAPRACIENALHFEIPGEIQRELMILIIIAQHQNAQASASHYRKQCTRLRAYLAIVQLKNALANIPWD